MSGEVVGTVITRNDVAAGANVATVVNAGAGRINDTLAAAPGYSVVQIPFLANKKAGANTDIEYVYATTDAPHSGVIQFFVEYKPITADGALVAV